MATGPRPFGVGPYGTDKYSRYEAYLPVPVPDRRHVRRSRHPAGGHLRLRLRHRYRVRRFRRGPGITVQPAAVTGLVFDARAHDTLSWASWAPCEAGGWQRPPGCETGAWTPPGGCGTGVWTGARLT